MKNDSLDQKLSESRPKAPKVVGSDLVERLLDSLNSHPHTNIVTTFLLKYKAVMAH